MGFKLKTQIAGILFLLFALTVVIIGYFNMSILYEATKGLAMEQSASAAASLVAWARKTVPLDDASAPQLLHQRLADRADMAAHLGEIKGLRSFQILTPDGRVLYSFGVTGDSFPPHEEVMRGLRQSGRSYNVLWEYDSLQDLAGRPVEGRSTLLLSRFLAFISYTPVLVPTQNDPVAFLRLSLTVEEMPRRLRLTLLGNVILGAIFLVTAFIAISIWTANAINRPLEFILQGQERIGRGDFSAHVSVDIPSTNEIVSISTSFNRMAADLRRFKKELEVKTVRLESLNNEYKRLNEHLETEVERKTEELKEFFSVVTHDMKVPLAAIQGYADLLLRSRNNPLNDKQQRFVHGISTACSHLLGMTRNMLESVKYDAGKITYYMEDFDLGDVVAAVASQIKQQAEEKGVHIRYDVPPLCRSVRGDSTKITQVITNLVNNAVKFTPERGTIEIRARDRGAMVEIDVVDSGVGIGEDQLPHLFEKFTQFHTQEGAASSIGLGLYIVNKILEGHGQTIRVDSHLGNGSTFTFTLVKAVRKERPTSLEALDVGATESQGSTEVQGAAGGEA